MPSPRRGVRDPLEPEAKRGSKKSKPMPQAFVLDALESVSPSTRPMFGCQAVYLDERIVFVLRDKGDSDDGVWLAFEPALVDAVLARFPRLRPIDVFGGSVKGWLKLSAKDESFEEDALAACALVVAGSTLIGKVPTKKRALKARDRG